MPLGDFALTRFNPDGSTDNSFNSGFGVFNNFGIFKTYGRAVVMQPNGKFVVAGTQGSMGDDDIAVIRYNADGTPDSSLGIGGKVWTHVTDNNDLTQAMALQPDGKVLVAASSGFGTTVVRYGADGLIDNTFDGDGIAIFQNALFH